MAQAAPALVDQSPNSSSKFLDRFSERQLSAITILVFSVAYISQTLIRASEKRFWFDELCTYFICRQPTFHDSWAAVLHGADFNPPLFYLIQRAAAALFGFGLIGFRAPQMLAFWVFCLCLFFVAKRFAGVFGGFIAMAFPLLSGAYFYAYEARPHGLVLGFAGLAFLCWSRLLDQPRSVRWLLAFAVCLEGAFLVHCYAVLIAVPFALVELVRTVRTKSINPWTWLAVSVPGVIAGLAFLPLLQSFRRYLSTAPLTKIFPPSLKGFPDFYQSFFQPCILLLLVLIVLLAVEQVRSPKPGWLLFTRNANAGWLLLLAVGFLGMPLYGILLAKLVHGPFFARYFSSVAIGVGILLSLSLYGRDRSRWALTVTSLVASLLIFNAAAVVWHRAHGWGEIMIEPSSGYGIDSDPSDSLETYSLLTSASQTLPIGVPSLMDYLYLLHYWPSAQSRLFVIIPSKASSAYVANRGLFEYCHLPGHDEVTYDQFMREHPDFLVYSSQMEYRSLPSKLVGLGAEIRSFVFDHRANYVAHLQVHRLTQ